MGKKLQVDVLCEVAARQSGIAMDVVVLESVDSTNSWCLQQCKAGKKLPYVCFSETQTQGRGRRGKDWLMSPGSNIAMSLTWSFVISQQPLYLLSLSIAVAIAETLENFAIDDVQIKWPNDVYVNGKKIAGILIETQPVKTALKQEEVVAVIIGIGLNYDMSMLDNEVRQTLTLTDISSEVILQLCDIKPERLKVASTLLKNIITVCQNYQVLSKQNLEKFRARYDYCKDKNVEVKLDNSDVVSGLAQGVNDSAELLVSIDGRQQAFNSAEVSVLV